MHKYAFTVAAAFAVALAVAFAGCSKVAEKAQEKVLEKALSADGQKADVDIKKDGVTVKTDEGTVTTSAEGVTVTGKDGTMSFTGGANAKVPDTFPKDIPIYPGATIEMALDQGQQEMFMVHAASKDAVDTIADYYKKELAAQGWQADQTMEMANPQPMKMFTFLKGERELTVTITREDEQSRIGITTGKP